GGLCQEHVRALRSAVEQYLVLQLDVLVQFLTENLQFAVQGSPGAARILRWLVVVGQPAQPGQALTVLLVFKTHHADGAARHQTLATQQHRKEYLFLLLHMALQRPRYITQEHATTAW